MSEHGPQGPNGVTLADRTIRQLGVQIANTTIAMASQSAQLEEVLELASYVDFHEWENASPPPPSQDMEGRSETTPAPPQQYLVPGYQVDVVVWLLALLQQQ